jgi:CDGSH-type Zn-finger protein
MTSHPPITLQSLAARFIYWICKCGTENYSAFCYKCHRHWKGW